MNVLTRDMYLSACSFVINFLNVVRDVQVVWSDAPPDAKLDSKSDSTNLGGRYSSVSDPSETDALLNLK